MIGKFLTALTRPRFSFCEVIIATAAARSFIDGRWIAGLLLTLVALAVNSVAYHRGDR
ncbi:hypothetical protein [Sphingomonas sp.]|uniref:hypothetical protein n=1 Tax=Sphingomonas sp. TaxID=28214 RepID=UPI003F71A35B